ncbi:phosphoribosylamine--glycine ligase [Caloramator quimbayensis]|uniref:Phosphoribosylamine--glycine ligase n=1 Tax=Caloramator quimbayensis TaxID=1147123 RepID=A0A1T4XQ98_9CLOT|nr:phosphoribosylamine--glycine ligase [Caloramator quimbayensis]SKA91717.1 phosphoribosylamine--glycine ligase [Caloramator quimbayensis]
MKVLVVGSGGREHAIAYKASKNEDVDVVYCAKGNGGTALEYKCVNVDISTKDEILDFALREKIDLTIVGPEAYLVDGIVDDFKEKNLRIFGPSQRAANLEGSKAFAKEFMKKYNVKTAKCEVFEDYGAAIEYINKCGYPIVIKADGLAAGKGVVICQSFEEGEKTLRDFMIEGILKSSGEKVVIEEYLEGVEATILSITDGNTIIPFISSKDHKTIFEGGKGPNTGGMGVIAPNPYCSEEVLREFERDILNPTLKGIKEENFDYCGIIYFGIMITKKGVYLLEYNVRMGDPETQAVLPLLKTDFIELIEASIDKSLDDIKVEWIDGASCCVVASSKGYPEKYETGHEISIGNVCGKVFIAGAALRDEKLITTGGRVLSVVCVSKDLDKAREAAYEDIKKINFSGMYYRKDIGE